MKPSNFAAILIVQTTELGLSRYEECAEDAGLLADNYENSYQFEFDVAAYTHSLLAAISYERSGQTEEASKYYTKFFRRFSPFQRELKASVEDAKKHQKCVQSL